MRKTPRRIILDKAQVFKKDSQSYDLGQFDKIDKGVYEMVRINGCEYHFSDFSYGISSCWNDFKSNVRK
jgi:hypothetical protein